MEKNILISQELLSKKELLTTKITLYHFEKLEEQKRNRLEYLKRKTKEDTDYNIIHLSEAIRYGSKHLFYNYVLWLKTLLKYYGVATEDLIEHFEISKQIMSQHFAKESYDEIALYLDKAIEALKDTMHTEGSFLKETNRHYEIARSYLDAILETNRGKAINIILTAVKTGIPVEEIYLDVFQPVQYEIGWLWQSNKISVGQEHYATAVTQLAMSQLYPFIFTQEKKDYRFIACGVSEELHELGIRMVADIFEMNGWDTYFMGANTPAVSIIKIIEEKNIQVLALSATMLYHLRKVDEFIDVIKSSTKIVPKIIVGGHAFKSDPDLWKKIGADAYASDPKAAIIIAKNLINQN